MSASLGNNSWVVQINGNAEVEPGTIALKTGNLIKGTGNIETGAKLNTSLDNTVVITLQNEGQIFSGHFVASTTWALGFNDAIGRHYYTLTGKIVDDTGNAGTLTLVTQTDPVQYMFFNKSEIVETMDITLTMKQ